MKDFKLYSLSLTLKSGVVERAEALTFLPVYFLTIKVLY